MERLNREKVTLERRLAEAGAQSSRIGEYENKIGMLGQEIERLNYILKSKVSETEEARTRAGKVEFEFESYRSTSKREIEESRRVIQQLQTETSSSRDIQLTLSKVSTENKFLAEENMRAQEGLRMSTNQVSKLMNDINDLKHENDNLKRRLQETGAANQKLFEAENKLAMLSQEIERLTNIINSKNTENNALNMKLHDLEGMNRTIQVLQEKISRLTGENFSLGEDMKNAQDSLRLSTSQASKVTSELNDLKNRVHVLTSELESKNREIRSLNDRLGETEGTKEQIKRENMTLSQRMIEIDRLGKDIGQLQQNIIKLTKENQALNTEYLSTQENLRVSTSQTAKLAAELTELRNRVAEYEVRIKRADDELLRYKQENSNHQQRFQEIEKQTRIMGDLQKQVIALAKENEMLTQDNARAQESLRVSTS